MLLRNIEETAQGKDATTSALIATLRGLSGGVVFVQSVTP